MGAITRRRGAPALVAAFALTWALLLVVGCAAPAELGKPQPAGSPGAAATAAPRVWLLQRSGDLPIQEFVAAARWTLDCEIYEVTSQSLADALGVAAARGVRVRVILEPRAWSTLMVRREPGVEVLPPPAVDLDHAKSCVRDAGTPDAAVLVGTANWSGAASSTDADLELLLPGSDPAARQVAAVIDADVAGRPVPGAAAPAALAADEAVVSPFDARSLLEGLATTPGSRLLVTSEELRDPAVLADLEAASRTEPVLVAAPASERTPPGTVRCATPVYMHAKVAVLWVHGAPALAFLGSENLSAQSLDGNREIGVIVGPALAAAIAAAIAPVLACGGWPS